MSYHKNMSNRQIDQFEDAAADSTIVVNTTEGDQKDIGNPLGAGILSTIRLCGVVGAFGDKDYIVNNKAGKKRTSDTGQ